MNGRCICGCGAKAVQMHHVITRQQLRRVATPELPYGDLVEDPRNLVPVAFRCHERHHQRAIPLPMHRLPSDVFRFAGEVMGGPAAYEWLARHYEGRDLRHEALLEETG